MLYTRFDFNFPNGNRWIKRQLLRIRRKPDAIRMHMLIRPPIPKYEAHVFPGVETRGF